MNAQIVHAQSGGRALIIGAGIGGLAVAVALGRAGFTVHVFESASSLEPTVTATPLLPSAVRALRALGMAPTVPTLRVAVAGGVLRSARGHTLVTIATSDLAYRFGAVSAAVHRADFQHLLLSSLPAGTVRPNARCVGVEQDAGGVAAHFADGSIARGDVLIGADGPHAIVRAHLFGAPPRCLARRGTASAPSGASRGIVGNGRSVRAVPAERCSGVLVRRGLGIGRRAWRAA